MAVPTATLITPNTGSASGNQPVVITGTNFKVPVLAYTIPMVDSVPTVSVTFGGIAAIRVDVISATQLYVLLPRYTCDPRADSFNPVNVVISNLTSSGTVIPGETVTKTNFFNFQRMVLGSPRKDPPLLKVLSCLLKALQVEVGRHTGGITNIDYGEQGQIAIDTADLPNISLTVDAPRDIEYSEGDWSPVEVERPDGTADQYEGQRTHMLVCDVLAAAGVQREAFFLIQAIEDFCIKNPELPVPCDADLYPGQTDNYFVEVSKDPTLITVANVNGVIGYNMQIRVRGITVLMDDPLQNLHKIAAFALTNSIMSGGTPRTTVF